MRALMVEQYSPATQVFIEGLNAATGCVVDHAQSIDEGLGVIRAKRPDLVLVNLDQLRADAWSVAERIRHETTDAISKCPHIVVLSKMPRPIRDAAKCRDLQAVCMLREFWPPIYEEARVALWLRYTKKFRSTLRIEFAQGHHSLHFCTNITSQQLRLSSRLAQMAVIMAGRLEFYAVEQLADELGVCRQTIKKYMLELREASLQTQRELMISEPDKTIFWMERRPGGTICGIRANIVSV